MEGLEFTNVRLNDTLALRTIQQHGFHIVVIKSELGLKTVLIWLPDGIQSGKCTESFPKSGFDVLLCPIVYSDNPARISEVVYKLKWFTTGCDHCRRSSFDSHYLSLGCVDLKTCLLSIGFQSSSLLL